jgi:formylglycine-generating enzyme required for sulfatase activity
MGSTTAIDAFAQPNEKWHQVTLTHDYYIGVFEVTQNQWRRVMDTAPSGNANSSGTYDMPLRPVEQVAFSVIRGGDWPVSDVTPSGTFVNALRSKTGMRFDLPTEAQLGVRLPGRHTDRALQQLAADHDIGALPKPFPAGVGRL